MKIATFNLENLGRRLADASEFERRLNILRPQIERLDADILCLQEIDGTRTGSEKRRRLTALDRLISGTVYEKFECVSTVHPATHYPADRHNLAILSRWPIEAHAQHLHSLVPPPIHTMVTGDPPYDGNNDRLPALCWDRPVQHARIALPDRADLHVINLHLKAPLAAAVAGQKIGPFAWKTVSGWAEGFYIAAIKRAGQALETRLLVDRIFDEDRDAKILVAGDFNAEEREVPIRLIAAGLDDTGNGALAERAMVALEHSLPDTRRYSVIHRGRKTMMDHLMASRALLADYVGIEIHNETLGDELVAYAAIRESPESYHAPIVASFRITSETKAG